jgi:hypothetical protein
MKSMFHERQQCSKVMETLKHFRYMGLVGETAVTSWDMSFRFLLYA